MLSTRGKLLFYIFTGVYSGWIFYNMLLPYDPQMLSQPGFGWRRDMVRLMLSIMSPIEWGWFMFIFCTVVGFIRYWQLHRLEDLPDNS